MSTVEAPREIGQKQQHDMPDIYLTRQPLGFTRELGAAALEEHLQPLQPRKIDAAVRAFRLVRNRRPQ